MGEEARNVAQGKCLPSMCGALCFIPSTMRVDGREVMKKYKWYINKCCEMKVKNLPPNFAYKSFCLNSEKKAISKALPLYISWC